MIDQLSKLFILSVIKLDQISSWDVFPPFITFRMGWNTGINFGLFSNNSEVARWVLIVLSLFISLIILLWSIRNLSHWFELALAGILIGGACSNAIDRIIHGAVVDFLNMSCCGIHNPFVFNIADITIVGGAMGLLILSMLAPSKG